MPLEGSDPIIDSADALSVGSLPGLSWRFRGTAGVARLLRRLAERISDIPPQDEEDGATTRPSGRPSQEEP